MLMRLSKQNFNALLKDPLLERVSPDDARQQVNKGAVWLDVRHAKEFTHARLPKAINIPLHEVRLRLNELDKDKNYICYCSTGRRSSAAAFLLVQNGFKASVLNGGIKVMAQDLVR
jgi:rhodanese-related sulfurtransferase